MARRHSLQNQRPSHGPASSINEPIVNPGDDADQEHAGDNKKRKRSTSFTGFFTKFLPSHRPERSGTLRDQGFWEHQHSQPSDLPVSERRPPLSHRHGSDSIVSSGWNPAIPLPQRSETVLHHRQKRPGSTREQSNPLEHRPTSLTPRRQRARGRDKQLDSPPINIPKETVHTEAEFISPTASQQPRDPRAPGETVIGRIASTLDAKREARRLRRSLKESGDFLGVQGVNPQTGVMDVLTPTSSSPTDRTMMSAPEPKGYSGSMADFRAEYHHAARTRDAEEASLERLRQEQERLDKMQRKKDSIRTFQQRVRWRKDKNQWSSVAEPDLSPIADASTRTGTPSRSTSAGAFGQPPGIQKVLRWEEQQQRSASTPAGVQTTTSTPQQSRPGIVAQVSSDTVIHTPHPAGERRYSMVPDIFRKGYLSTIASSSPTPRRAPDPAADPVVGSPSSSKNNGGIAGTPVRPPKEKQKPSPLKITIPNIGAQTFTPFPMDDQDSFLGARIEPGGASHRHIRDQAIISPATSMWNNQNENSFLGGSPNMDETPAGSPPDVAVRDFGKGMNRKVWFVQHPSSPGSPSGRSPPRQSRSVDQGRSTNGDIATSSLSPQRNLPLHRKPLMSLPRGPSPTETNLLSGTKVEDGKMANLIDVGIQLDSKASGWAKQLMEDIASFGQDNPWDPAPRSHPRQSSADISPRTKIVEPVPVPASMSVQMPAPAPMPTPLPTPPAEETTSITETPRAMIGEPSSRADTTQPRSASIPTTTITGYDQRLLAHTRGLHRQLPRFDGTAESVAHKDDRVIRISAMEAATKLELEKQRAREENHERSRDGRVTRVSIAELAGVEVAETETDQPPPMMTPALTSVRRQTQPGFDLLASPPRLPPSVWPSLDIAAPLRQRELKHLAAEGRQLIRATEPAVAEMGPYVPGPQPANGTTSSHQRTSVTTDHQEEDEEHLSVPAKTALLYNQEMQQQQQPPPIVPTTSAPQLAATRDRCEKIYRRVSRRLPKAVTGQEPLTTPATGHNSNHTMATTYKAGTGPPVTGAAAASSLTSTSTYHQLEMQMPKYRYMPAHPSSSRSGSANSSRSTSFNSTPSSRSSPSPEKNNSGKETVTTTNRAVTASRDEATEAARTALVGTHCSAATGRIVQVRPSVNKGKSKSGTGTTTSTTENVAVSGLDGGGAQNQEDKKEKMNPRPEGGDTAGLSKGSEKQPIGSDKDSMGAERRFPLTKDPHMAPGGKKAKSRVLRLLAAYWELILPVFEAGSPISKRFSAGQSTWRDCGVYALALVFVLAAFLAVVWGVKGMLLVGALGRAVLKGCLVLVGF